MPVCLLEHDGPDKRAPRKADGSVRELPKAHAMTSTLRLPALHGPASQAPRAG